MKSYKITVKYDGPQSKKGEASFFRVLRSDLKPKAYCVIMFTHIEVVGNNFILYCSDNGATEKGRLCGIYGLDEFDVVFMDATLKSLHNRG